mmetsp:Transcript_14973/g.21355  ORF Transcript_14973/g.21355 Transcript_14973/m.21355 type:complete len:330 (+) Transcript_14973:243-1232(+)|eukprot:CAMPEP_0172432574 /NCGR_PEP_ID=MMETSP1064-20121228/64099_1 /TAXON_ID=202472 /ORGANISM="Aulacoseira subarctica , Strain CCAP 1002/5" /LENGTH=329 /DNA_ID=CAMNT_0013180001 /DNA_START=167 /DNA_END=1156 /DNA_ORIENTATION=+
MNFIPPAASSGPIRAVRTDEISINDVLCGRGGDINVHVGNEQFRKIVESKRMEYLTARFKREKRLIASSVVKEIQNLVPPGRFLSKIQIPALREKIVDESVAVGGDTSTGDDRYTQDMFYSSSGITSSFSGFQQLPTSALQRLPCGAIQQLPYGTDQQQSSYAQGSGEYALGAASSSYESFLSKVLDHTKPSSLPYAASRQIAFPAIGSSHFFSSESSTTQSRIPHAPPYYSNHPLQHGSYYLMTTGIQTTSPGINSSSSYDMKDPAAQGMISLSMQQVPPQSTSTKSSATNDDTFQQQQKRTKLTSSSSSQHSSSVPLSPIRIYRTAP